MLDFQASKSPITRKRRSVMAATIAVLLTFASSAFASGLCQNLVMGEDYHPLTARKALQMVRDQLSLEVLGQEELLDTAIMALILNGHIYMKSAPGAAKSLTGEKLAESAHGVLKKITFSPDKSVRDILGGIIQDRKTGDHVFRPGPVFANIVLADEFNRASPKTTIALLEAMNEGYVTDEDGVRHPLPPVYLVIATTNPHDNIGTYPVAQASEDRFLFSVDLDYPSEDVETRIVRLVRERNRNRIRGVTAEKFKITTDMILEARFDVLHVYVPENVDRYITRLTGATRAKFGTVPPALEGIIKTPTGTRGALGLDAAAQAHAWLDGRDEVRISDVQAVAHRVLRHRIYLANEVGYEDWTVDKVIDILLQSVPQE